VAFAADASESRALFLTRDAAERAARKHGWFVAELFARPTLTDDGREVERLRLTEEERDAIHGAMSWLLPLCPANFLLLESMLKRTGGGE
jgi:hypothetical protein